jgi:hypothetical protein
LVWPVLLVVATVTCGPQGTSKPNGCADDPSLCPTSPKTATRVGCNCTCQLPHIPMAGADLKFRGSVFACLPPSLNVKTGAPSDVDALGAMSQATYNQRVFEYCSVDVAGWLSLTVKSQLARLEQVPAGLACQPYDCTCDTLGADDTYSPCESRCTEAECDDANCDPILRQGGIIELTSCTCTRTTACGFSTPAHDLPGICRAAGNLPD